MNEIGNKNNTKFLLSSVLCICANILEDYIFLWFINDYECRIFLFCHWKGARELFFDVCGY